MSLNYELRGNTLVCDDVKVGAAGTSVATTLSGLGSDGVAAFPAAALDDPGDDAGTPAAFDKVIKVDVGGTDYWIGVYNNNTTA